MWLVSRSVSSEMCGGLCCCVGAVCSESKFGEGRRHEALKLKEAGWHVTVCFCVTSLLEQACTDRALGAC